MHTRKLHHEMFGNFFLLFLLFSQSYHLPIFTFSTLTFDFKEKLNFTHLQSARRAQSTRFHDDWNDFFSFHIHTLFG